MKKLLALTVLLVMLTLFSATPAVAQESAGAPRNYASDDSASQYQYEGPSDRNVEGTTQEARAASDVSARDARRDADDGADAYGAALNAAREAEAGEAAANQSAASASEPGSSTPGENDTEEAADIERLPDTGGAKPLVPVSGLLLVSGGLLAFGLSRRWLTR